MRTVGLGLVAASLLLAACGKMAPSNAIQAGFAGGRVYQAGGLTRETLGDRSFKLYTPKSVTPAKAAPLVVMLHGCTQDPTQFATGSRMNLLAEKEGFYVLYPDQPRTAHPFKCWRWFEPINQQRGEGEVAQIVAMVNAVKGKGKVDNGAVFVAGISAGAAMASNLGATYPDVFAAIAVASGLEFGAAHSEAEGQGAMRQGGMDPKKAGQLAYQAMGAKAQTVPAIVFHGADDRIVMPVNGDQVTSQWAKTNDLASDGQDDDNVNTTPDGKEEGQAPNGKRYTRWFFNDRNTGKTIIEKVVVSGMGHAWSGGDAAGSYTDPKGPDASALTWRFFANARRPAARR